MLDNYTYSQQKKMADYCRSGEETQIDGVNKNISHYRRLVFNIIDEALSSAYPLAYKLMDIREWNDFIGNFFSASQTKSPLVWQMPKDLLEYYENNNIYLKEKYPFLMDLLRFEWTEIEIYMMENLKVDAYENEGSWFEDEIVLNHEHTILPLNYPVHIKNASLIDNTDKSDYFVLIYREPDTYKVEFINLSVLFAFVVDSMARGYYLCDILVEAAKIFNIEDKKLLYNKIMPFLIELKEKQFIFGFK